MSARPWSSNGLLPRSPQDKRAANAAVTLATALSVPADDGQHVPNGSPFGGNHENDGHAAGGSHTAANGHGHSHRHGHAHGHTHSATQAAAKAVTAEEHRLTGHRGSVLCARVYRGQLLFSGSTDGSLKVQKKFCNAELMQLFPGVLAAFVSP